MGYFRQAIELERAEKPGKQQAVVAKKGLILARLASPGLGFSP
jgi:hypothetical protein